LQQAASDTLEPFLGLWVDPCGRALFVRRKSAEERGRSSCDAWVSVTELASHPSQLDQGSWFPVDERDATAEGDALTIEAGVVGLGPTYRLRRAENDRLLPSVGMGLYDDYDDDLGVPWAFPLEPYRRATPDERNHWSAARAAMNKP
jgi:hypothetical protein